MDKLIDGLLANLLFPAITVLGSMLVIVIWKLLPALNILLLIALKISYQVFYSAPGLETRKSLLEATLLAGGAVFLYTFELLGLAPQSEGHKSGLTVFSATVVLPIGVVVNSILIYWTCQSLDKLAREREASK